MFRLFDADRDGKIQAAEIERLVDKLQKALDSQEGGAITLKDCVSTNKLSLNTSNDLFHPLNKHSRTTRLLFDLIPQKNRTPIMRSLLSASGFR